MPNELKLLSLKKQEKLNHKKQKERTLNEKRKNDQTFLIDRRILTTTIICISAVVISFALSIFISNELIILMIIFGAVAIGGEAYAFPQLKHKPIAVSYIAIPALARTIPLEGQLLKAYWPYIVFSLVVSITAALLIRHISITKRLLFASVRTICFITGFVTYRQFLYLLPNNKLTVAAALTISIASMLLVNGIVNIVQKNFEDNEDQYTIKVFSAYAIIVLEAVFLGYMYGGHYGESVIVNTPKLGGVGLSVLLVTVVIMLSLRFPYSRIVKIYQNNLETQRALATAPERGGLVPVGHAARKAAIAVTIAKTIGLPYKEVAALEEAAYYVNLGFALTDQEHDGSIENLTQASLAVVKILYKTDKDSRIASIIEGHIIAYRGVVNGVPIASNDVTAMILRIANDYEIISREESNFGINALNVMSNNLANLYSFNVYNTLYLCMTNEYYKHLWDPIAFSYFVTEEELIPVNI